MKGWSQELTWFKQLKASYHHQEHIQILMRNFITGCYIKQAFHVKPVCSCWPTQFNQFKSLLVRVYKLHNIHEDLGQTAGISMALSKQRTLTTFHVKLSKTQSPLYSIIWVICERVGLSFMSLRADYIFNLMVCTLKEVSSVVHLQCLL